MTQAFKLAKKILFLALFLALFGCLFAPKANAVYFNHISDTITTSRPSTLVPFEAVTAKHTIVFTTTSVIPVNGEIIITFSGSGDNTTSPSATTFAFNNLQPSNITANFSSGTSTCSFVVSAPTVICKVTGAQINAGVKITIVLGATTPTLINPTKSATAGTADIWRINIKSQDSASVSLDIGFAKMAVIEPVQVQATVGPSFTFRITPVSGAINTGNAIGCTNTESVNSDSTATTVNLGILDASAINISTQLITITTNAMNGYVLTAISSGHLTNPDNGIWIPDSTTPKAIAVGVPWFGIHPCGLNVNTITWGIGATGRGVNAKYGWPTPTTPLTVASATVGPIGNVVAAGGVGAGLTSVEYAGTINASTATGSYKTVITYTATPAF